MSANGTQAHYKGVMVNMKDMLLDMLECVEYTHSYIFTVYSKDSNMFACVYDDAREILREVTDLYEYNGKLRVRMDNHRDSMDNLMYKADRIIPLGTRKDFERYAKQYKNRWGFNRGYYNEIVIAKAMNGRLNKAKNAKLTDCGDMVVNGKHYQLKLYNATVCHENRLINMMKRKVEV